MSAPGKKKDLVILIPLERTGNVMFQMAAVYSYCRDHSYTPCIDTSNNPCAASLNKFLGDPLCEKKAHGLLMDYRSLNYLPIPDKKEWTCLRGWFQDRRFFLSHEEEIREIFSPLTGVTEPGRVGIHLRLGDYLGSRFSKDYYTLSKRDILRALEHMRDAGYGYAIIGWVSDAADFYRKTVGAQFIPGGEPENTVYANMVLLS